MKHYLIDIPETLLKAISKQLKISNPPNLEDVETVVLWCVSASLAGEIFNDTMTERRTSKKALKQLKWELKQYIKELKEENATVQSS